MVRISERLAALRAAMKEHQIDAWIVPSSDPHQSEYVAEHWTGRAWASGFSGSAGTLVVLGEQAGLWTDGRYFIQAEQELQGTGVQLMREGNAGVPTMGEWLQAQLESGSTIGFDGKTMSLAAVRRLEKSFGNRSFVINSDRDLLEGIWTDRPSLPAEKVFLHEDHYAGRTREQKFEQVRKAMAAKGADHLLISSLDDIAWLFNLRGSDIECNPVFLAYTIFSKDQVQLYINDARIEPVALQALKASNVVMRSYDAIAADLGKLAGGSTIQLDPATTSRWLIESLPESVQIIEGASPSNLMKAVKNEVEIASMKHCHRRDGVAIVRFMRWLEGAIPTRAEDEVSLDEKLEGFRAESPEFKGPSFPTIAGYGPNGAICHYRAEKATCLTVEPRGLLLVDSGGQYPDGTTDITRTFACGDMTDEEKRDYTLVLKSHINLAKARFKKGARGIQLDMMTRMPLWELGMDFNHGTGHGVGYFLNVHEGPQSVSPRCLDVPLKPGMLITNEPGMYRAGKHGIRIENIMLVTEDMENEFGQFYKLEPLTLAPIDTKPLVMDLLTGEEVEWLNQYHAKVLKELSGVLDGDDLVWLKEATQAI
ncbi:aminopeptidase P family protein [Endozoicomonas sp. Mp262]|uniref:aminopeptidase P family protein n=1 Tax=Endozoicomonas sp. Mp262 TaxID=2919499 RepID=UPI0021D8206E